MADILDRQRAAYHALAEHLKTGGHLGEDCPLVEICWSEHTVGKPGPGSRKSPELHLIPSKEADSSQVELAHQQARSWDWGPGRPPKITLESAR